ncbi:MULTISPECIES: glutathione S-transferase family protein [unclassified Photobacterium]|uniref:glutathione S-transferase family protein n=1 Tax=unclassified Photobacterium TaxID=2628852 RepID=UPI000D1676BB|nr:MULTISPECIES: glutathione S-transferase family protein [unclassified Photobacterium]PSV34102.1 glutathione-dependent reductase [Photobacterium sp. GB-27]PSV54143.1 glutathione-dependent reductase [Photobacterium sp. GB-1]PSV54794.1 glutathione-dependent reductase [Photobacterium sp. GB-3]
MGLLVDGKWHTDWYDTKSTGGKFERKASSFRHWVTKDGQAGPSGEAGFKAEPHRYHLYVSLACPWAHRAIIYRKLKGLEPLISMSVVNAFMGEDGWNFALGDDVVVDPIINAEFMHQIYTHADPHYTGRVTVPVLWDKQNQTIVTNESAEIIRMFNSAFDDVGANSNDFYPEALQTEIDALNDFVYVNINNGVYRAGFATTQEAYDEAVVTLFNALDAIEARLTENRYLLGDKITEADWRLFTTLVRFDAVYVGHFKCNLKRLVDYPNIWGYLRDLYQAPGIADTVNIDYIKAHYYGSHETINPTRIIPKGPVLDFSEPHCREKLGAEL